MAQSGWVRDGIFWEVRIDNNKFGTFEKAIFRIKQGPTGLYCEIRPEFNDGWRQFPPSYDKYEDKIAELGLDHIYLYDVLKKGGISLDMVRGRAAATPDWFKMDLNTLVDETDPWIIPQQLEQGEEIELGGHTFTVVEEDTIKIGIKIKRSCWKLIARYREKCFYCGSEGEHLCPICNGTQKCPSCDGTGKCSACDGTGKINGDECWKCKGNGKCHYGTFCRSPLCEGGGCSNCDLDEDTAKCQAEMWVDKQYGFVISKNLKIGQRATVTVENTNIFPE